MYEDLKDELTDAYVDRNTERTALIKSLISDIVEKCGDDVSITDADVIEVIQDKISGYEKVAQSVKDDEEYTAYVRGLIHALINMLPGALEDDDLRIVIQGLEVVNREDAINALKEQAQIQGFHYDVNEAVGIIDSIY